MAFTRKYLTTLGIEETKIDEIISAHSEVVEGLKAERDGFKEKATKYDGTIKELEELKKSINNNNSDEVKKKLDEVTKQFDDYKKQVADEKLLNSKKKAYSNLLKEAGIAEKRFEQILKITDLKDLKLNDDGKFENTEDLTKAIKEEWSEFISKPVSQGANPANPPSNNGGKTTMTKDDIAKIKDPVERQKAIVENASLFGIQTQNNND